MARFTIYEDDQGEFRWRLQADNNRITADSAEGYSTEYSCELAVDRVREEVAEASIQSVDD